MSKMIIFSGCAILLICLALFALPVSSQVVCRSAEHDLLNIRVGDWGEKCIPVGNPPCDDRQVCDTPDDCVILMPVCDDRDKDAWCQIPTFGWYCWDYGAVSCSPGRLQTGACIGGRCFANGTSTKCAHRTHLDCASIP